MNILTNKPQIGIVKNFIFIPVTSMMGGDDGGANLAPEIQKNSDREDGKLNSNRPMGLASKSTLVLR